MGVLNINVGDVINISTLKSSLKTYIASQVPSTGYQSDSSSLPQGLYATYLCTRAGLISDIDTYIDNYGISSGSVITASTVWDMMNNAMRIMGRCRKLYWDDQGTASPGSQTNAESRAAALTTAGIGTWTFFNDSFTWNTTITLNYMPPTASNASVDLTGVSYYPDYTLSWNSNTKEDQQVSANAYLQVGQVAKIIESVDNQIVSFKDTYYSRNNNSAWWNGSVASPGTSNRVLLVRYWCHSNCHSNCHSSHSDRSRR